MPNLFISVMRTAVPLVAGWLLTLAVRAGVDIGSEQVVAAVTALLTLAYYLAFRGLEVLGQRARGTTLQNIAGWFLGWARPPAYPTSPSTAPAAERPGPVAI
ncbi:hypothetical protein [Streptomyces sp. MJP52]|uniref:hypothetical protein n=1 Tax=Streptomyces sp. MJP52 TaxID=2940555 RepID=UPI0024765558|nr:hypothetical protein [Streptomyces sp. MJP52]MDH6226197.1 uncharacterized membrane protein YfbV (UPF0208 family) [Streptomyces sp. MJP52]